MVPTVEIHYVFILPFFVAGAPNRIFYKSEDKMKIHSPNAHRKSAALKSDYFYNYFLIGMVSRYCNTVPYLYGTGR